MVSHFLLLAYPSSLFLPACRRNGLSCFPHRSFLRPGLPGCCQCPVYQVQRESRLATILAAGLCDTSRRGPIVLVILIDSCNFMSSCTLFCTATLASATSVSGHQLHHPLVTAW
jgi:hypothetical protein